MRVKAWMIKELYIKNYALIDEMTLEFDPRLNILTGETGAGKTIIVGALGLMLGEVGKTSYIRSGTESCIVEGRIAVEKDHPVFDLLKSKGIDSQPGEPLVLRRIISTAGSSKSLINSQQVAAKDLQEVTSLLIDVHGQHEHQSLLNVKNHLALLDHYGRLHEERTRYEESYRKVAELRSDIEKHQMDEREKERRIDILQFSIKEIEGARLRDGEEEELEKQYRVLKNYETLATAIMNVYGLLKQQDSSVLALLGTAIKELERIKDISPEIEKLHSEFTNTRYVVEDGASALKGYMDAVQYEPGKIDRIISRLELLKSLKRKYGANIQEVQEYGRRCRQDLVGLERNEETRKELEKALSEELIRAQRHAIELSARRRVQARALEESVKKELSYLNMGKADFRVGISYKESEAGEVLVDGKRYALTPHGLDQVEFLISTNVGEPLMPLKNVASGGELSRIMLAIKTVLGNVDPIATFVFDEVDAGIGGKVAWAVGNRLKDLSRLKQILCMTHLAQIASKGDFNYRVEKVGKDQRTVTRVMMLKGDEKVEEIARMISGKEVSEAARRQAFQMIGET